MHKRLPLILILFFFSLNLCAQAPVDPSIQSVLDSINHFNEDEGKNDSISGQILGSQSEKDYERRYNFYKGQFAVVGKIGQTKQLDFESEINLELLKYSLQEELSVFEYKMYLNPILADEGFQTELAGMGAETPVTVQQFSNYILKLNDIPRYVEAKLALMRKGLALGICQPKAILDNYQNTYERHIVASAEQSVFWQPFRNRLPGISDAAWNAITEQGKKAILQSVVPAFQKIKLFFQEEYLPKTRTTIGVSNFPNGLDFYQDRVRHYTTTNLSYEEIYQLGLKEVARIKQEMQGVLDQLKYKGTMKEFIQWLRTDPKFYATTAEQLLKEASFIAKKIDGRLPMFFGKLPRQPYGVEAVPDYLAPTYTAGRYAGANIHSHNAAHYWVNTYDLKSRPLYALEALTLHESVPGHHLQIALTQELTNLPEFRRNLYVNAFGEGWGLYAEHLGYEIGLFQDPYSRFGGLTYEMWRACRLVIDVGLHAKGWTRQQAVDYLSGNSALSLHEVNTEINRYISWPGQALAYKIGELKLIQLRKRAEEQLKELFDVREFHDLVLSEGTVTMEILEKMVDRYISSKLAARPSQPQ